MQRGRLYPQSLDFWSEPDCPPTKRRPLELLEIQWRFTGPMGTVFINNSTGNFDEHTGTYAWLDFVMVGLSPFESAIFESIPHTQPGVRFDFDLQNTFTLEHYHSHLFTTEQLYPWQVGGAVLAPAHVDANTFTFTPAVDILLVPRRYY